MSLSAVGLTSIIHRVPQTKPYKKVKRGFGLLCATKHPKLSLTLILLQQASTSTVSDISSPAAFSTLSFKVSM